jgi:hypothetical protein
MKHLAVVLSVMFLFMACGAGGNDSGGVVMNGLEWLAGPDMDTSWSEAEEWLGTLEEGWRMPTVEELKGLYDTEVTSSEWWPYQTADLLVWASDEAEDGQAWYLEFNTGESYWYYRDFGSNRRVFAVRRP